MFQDINCDIFYDIKSEYLNFVREVFNGTF